MSEMKRECFKEGGLTSWQFLQSSKKIKIEKGLLDERIRPSLVSLGEQF